MRGLYLIADYGLLPRDRLLARVDAALGAGVRVLQARAKDGSQAERRQLVRDLAGMCRGYGIPLIVNDDLDLAAAVGAAGVHLGRDDADPAQARRRLGEDALVGVSCYNDLGRAEAAEASGASYVAFGSFYPSGVKPQAIQARPKLLRQARQQLHIPICAIGGITPDNAAPLLAAGADMVAVISAVLLAPDPADAARRLANLFAPEGRARGQGDP